MLTSDEFCTLIGIDTPSRIFEKTDPFGEPIEWFGWKISRTKINGRFRLYTIHAEPSGMPRAEFGKRYEYDMDYVDSRLESRACPIIGKWMVRRWTLGRRTVYVAVRRDSTGYKNKPHPGKWTHDPNVCAVCSVRMGKYRRITVNSVAHCVPCNRKAFVDLDKRARQILKIDREVASGT